MTTLPLFEADLTYTKEHYNLNTGCTIPEYWECTLLSVPTVIIKQEKEIDARFSSDINIYGTSQESSEDAIQDLISQLKVNNWQGRLKIYR